MFVLSYLVNLRQLSNLRPMQHPQRQAHHLQVLGARRCADVSRFGAHVVHYGALQPGDEEVGAFIDDGISNTGKTVEDDCS